MREAPRYTNSIVGAVASFDIDTDPGGQGAPGTVEISVLSSLACTWNIYDSYDNVVWWLRDTIPLVAPGQDSLAYDNTRRYVRIATTTIANHTVNVTWI
jgi:hypothetical protein